MLYAMTLIGTNLCFVFGYNDNNLFRFRAVTARWQAKDNHLRRNDRNGQNYN